MNTSRPKVRVLPPARTGIVRERRRISPPLRKGVYILPNLFTTGGLFCGFFSIISTIREDYLIAATAVLVAQIFDALDGRIARMTHTSSSFGVQYDSLSDLIAFGVAPGVLAYRWALEPWGAWGWLAAALYVTCGALRLARFNVQVEVVDKNNFVGLPIPAAAAVVAVTIQMYYFLGGEGTTNKHLTLLLLIYALASLMVSTLPYYSFKGLKLRHRQPFWILIAGIIVIQMTIAAPQIMLFSLFSLYTLSGLVRFLLRRGGTTPQVRDTVQPEEELQEPSFSHGLDSDEKSRL